jgi:hypothetical protein
VSRGQKRADKENARRWTTVTVVLDASVILIETDHHLFDTLYHAVALEHGDAVLVTADDRYRR